MQGDNKTALIIMAAGMGSRFGGLKQMTPVGPGGEFLLHYSAFDAVRAGFSKIIFVIKREMEQDFKRLVGDRISAAAEVEYVFQELDDLPPGFEAPQGRTKPWGTGHAVYSCRNAVDGPFAVINSDDYYGRECFSLLYEFLSSPHEKGKVSAAMAGYILKNTLSESGRVSRGVCEVGEGGMLCGITEYTHIERCGSCPVYTVDGGLTMHPLSGDSFVSMNCWAFSKNFMKKLEKLFKEFLSSSAAAKSLTAEFYLPAAVGSLIASGQAAVSVLPTADKWYGLTYPKDLEDVRAALAGLVKQGVYPKNLF